MFDRLGWLVLRLRYAFVVGWLIAAALFGILAPSLSQAGSARSSPRPSPPTLRCRPR